MPLGVLFAGLLAVTVAVQRAATLWWLAALLRREQFPLDAKAQGCGLRSSTASLSRAPERTFLPWSTFHFSRPEPVWPSRLWCSPDSDFSLIPFSTLSVLPLPCLRGQP